MVDLDSQILGVSIKSYLDLDPECLRPLNHAEVEALAQIAFLAEGEEEAMLPEDIDELPPIGRVVFNRLYVTPIRVTVAAAAFMTVLCDGRQPDAIVWAWTIYQLAKRLGRQELNLDDVARAFPKVPTDASRAHIWEQQRGHVYQIPFANLLDRRALWGIPCLSAIPASP